MASRGTKTARSTPVAAVKARMTTAAWITTLVFILCGVGLVMVGSASSVISMNYYGSPWSIFLRDVIWTFAGGLAFFIAARSDYHGWRRWSKPLLLAAFAGLVLVMIPGIGTSAGGASRWLGWGPVKIQPSEFMKLALVLFGADLLTKKAAAKVPAKQVAAPFALVAGAAALMVIAQPDLGTGMVLIVISAVMLYTVGLPRAFLVKAFLAIVALVGLAAVALPYRRARLLSFINPGAKSDGSGYQVVQSLIGLGSGNVTGLGLGNSREKWGLLPNAHTDFIFSVVGEELGLIGVLAVLVLVGSLAMKGYRAVDQAHDLFGKLLASAITTWIIAEAIVNIGAAIGVLPVTGIPLPFVSFGGTSLIVTMAAAGILVNVARQGELPKRRRAAAPRPQGARRPRPAATR